jgi:ArsR family transcriptional regulator
MATGPDTPVGQPIPVATATTTRDTCAPGFIDAFAGIDEAGAVASLAALAQPMRLRVFRALVGAGPAGLTPGVLSAMLDVPPSTLSFHLKGLARAGLVVQAREGRHLRYQPALARMSALLGYLTDHCCQAGDALGCAIPARTAAPAAPAAPCTG